jgi:hypothetical protein
MDISVPPKYRFSSSAFQSTIKVELTCIWHLSAGKGSRSTFPVYLFLLTNFPCCPCDNHNGCAKFGYKQNMKVFKF